MFRGERVSGSPAISFAVNADHASGFFAGGAVSIAADADPLLSSASQYAGYAVRRGETSVDFGLVHRDYGRMFDAEYRQHYFEGFVGVSHKRVRARFFVSPDYLKTGDASYYGEVNLRLAEVQKWSLNVHGGLSLLPCDASCDGKLHVYRDWSARVSRAVGAFSLSIGVSGTNHPIFSDDGGPQVHATVSRAF